MIELKTGLFPHQARAVEKLLPIKVGALYMEMGTGKTRTALEMIKRRQEAGKIDRVLWLCPCSVKTSLRADIKKHAEGALSFIAIHGIESLSSSVSLYAALDHFIASGKTMLVVDESNLVKNSAAIRTQRITRLARGCAYRLLLNGTPISNNEADLYAQWYLLDWRILGYRSYWSFAANHLEFDHRFQSRIRRVLNVDYLADKIAPYSYTVKKADCLSLPGKRALKAGFSLTPGQRAHYESTMRAFLGTFAERGGGISDIAIYRTFIALQAVTSGHKMLSAPEESIRHGPMFDSLYENPRIQCLKKVLKRAGEKVVIWVKFTHELFDIQKILQEEYGRDSTALFYGGISQRCRQQELERFGASARFLIANKSCAGYGLNLQYCHTAVYYNNDWSWATRAQSEDRLHRLGQAHDVEIVDIYAEDTIDQRILACLERKENLAERFRSELKRRNGVLWLHGRETEDYK